MNKNIIKKVFGVFLLNISLAAYLENIPVKLYQPDGSFINCYVTGDEFYSRLHDSDNYTIVQNFSDGYYYYAIKENNEIKPSLVRFSSNSDRDFLVPNIRISKEEYFFRRNLFKQGRERRDAPTFGTINNINIFIRFSDEEEFALPRSSYDWQFNSSDGPSLHHYFLEVSNDNLEVSTTHYPQCEMSQNLSYQDPYPRSYYQVYHPQTNPDGYLECPQWNEEDSDIDCQDTDYSQWRSYREHMLLKNAVDFIESEIPDDLDVDANNDGYVDNVTFLINGSPAGWSDLLWPHRWSLYLYDAYINGALVDGYNVNMSSGGYFNVGVLCHEFGHSLGAPDFYRYYDDSITPVGDWGLMAWNTSPSPQYPIAWVQHRYYKWIDCPKIDRSGTYQLNALTDHENHCYLLESPNSSKEHFVLEYRKHSGLYDSNLPGNYNGILVYRINLDINRNNIIDTLENEGGWPIGGNADGPPDEVYIYRGGGTLQTNGNIYAAIYNPQSGRTEISDHTSPSSFLSDGMPGGLNISNIGFPSDTIEFTCSLECSNSIDGDVNLDQSVNILDILLIVNYVLNLDYDSCSDINHDGIVNILDIIEIIEIAINND